MLELLGYGRDDLMQQNSFWVLVKNVCGDFTVLPWNDLIKVSEHGPGAPTSFLQ
jgi:hypothetical protein